MGGRVWKEGVSQIANDSAVPPGLGKIGGRRQVENDGSLPKEHSSHRLMEPLCILCARDPIYSSRHWLLLSNLSIVHCPSFSISLASYLAHSGQVHYPYSIF